MTDLAMILKFDPTEITSGSVRLMAEAAIEFLAVLQFRNCFARQMECVIELDRVRIVHFFGMRVERGMIRGEMARDSWRRVFFVCGSLHSSGVAVTEKA